MTFKKPNLHFHPLVSVKNMVPYQRIELYEGLGDSYRALEDLKKALDFYQEGLQIAQKNQISPKVIDLNSKIAGRLCQ